MSSSSSGGFPGSGPLGRSGKADPPNLSDYPDDPQYDLATVVQLVGVRPMTLWAWEQQLKIPRPQRVGDGTGGTVRHYSERDLVASIWLRDQILAGLAPLEAAERLMMNQRPTSANPTGSTSGEYPPVARRAPVNSGPLKQALMPGGPTGALDRPQTGAPMTGAPRIGSTTAPLGRPASASSMWGPQQSSPPSTGGPETMRGGPTNTLYASRPSGPLQTGPLSNPRLSGGSGARWPVPSGGIARDVRNMVPQLVRAFATFDTFTANRIVDEALSARSVETVAVGLLQPALSRVGDMWARNEMTIPEERYAINYIRGRLFTIFTTTTERFDGPLVIVACGPRELHDIGALMLATFWRRAGLRVVFLGQDVDGPALVQDVRMRRPRLVCISVMATQRVRALARIAKEITHMDAPTPTFAYSGAPFAKNPELQRRVNGVYLGDDPATATWHAMRLLGVDHLNNPPGGGTSPGTVGQAG